MFPELSPPTTNLAVADPTRMRCAGGRKTPRYRPPPPYNRCGAEDDERRLVDPNNPVVKLCVEGMQAEGEGRPEAARRLYERAWAESKDDFEACAAAHYLARQQPRAEETFRWNKVALECADATEDERVEAFYPSLYLNMGKSHEDLGDLDGARRCYELAAEKVEALPDEGYGGLVRRGITNGLRRIGSTESEGPPSPPSK